MFYYSNSESYKTVAHISSKLNYHIVYSFRCAVKISLLLCLQYDF